MKFNMNLKILVITLAFFTVIPFASADILPDIVHDALRDMFSGVPTDSSLKAIYAILMICLWYIGALFAIPKGKEQSKSSIKSIRVIIALVLGILTSIYTQIELLRTVFTAYGWVTSILFGLLPTILLVVLANVVANSMKESNPRLGHGLKALAYAISIVLLGVLAYTLEPTTSRTFGGDLSFRDIVDFTIAIFTILAIINLAQAIFGGGSSSSGDSSGSSSGGVKFKNPFDSFRDTSVATDQGPIKSKPVKNSGTDLMLKVDHPNDSDAYRTDIDVPFKAKLSKGHPPYKWEVLINGVKVKEGDGSVIEFSKKFSDSVNNVEWRAKDERGAIEPMVYKFTVGAGDRSLRLTNLKQNVKSGSGESTITADIEGGTEPFTTSITYKNLTTDDVGKFDIESRPQDRKLIARKKLKTGEHIVKIKLEDSHGRRLLQRPFKLNVNVGSKTEIHIDPAIDDGSHFIYDPHNPTWDFEFKVDNVNQPFKYVVYVKKHNVIKFTGNPIAAGTWDQLKKPVISKIEHLADGEYDFLIIVEEQGGRRGKGTITDVKFTGLGELPEIINSSVVPDFRNGALSKKFDLEFEVQNIKEKFAWLFTISEHGKNRFINIVGAQDVENKKVKAKVEIPNEINFDMIDIRILVIDTARNLPGDFVVTGLKYEGFGGTIDFESGSFDVFSKGHITKEFVLEFKTLFVRDSYDWMLAIRSSDGSTFKKLKERKGIKNLHVKETIKIPDGVSYKKLNFLFIANEHGEDGKQIKKEFKNIEYLERDKVFDFKIMYPKNNDTLKLDGNGEFKSIIKFEDYTKGDNYHFLIVGRNLTKDVQFMLYSEKELQVNDEDILFEKLKIPAKAFGKDDKYKFMYIVQNQKRTKTTQHSVSGIKLG